VERGRAHRAIGLEKIAAAIWASFDSVHGGEHTDAARL
jgi:hypothetical protein